MFLRLTARRILNCYKLCVDWLAGSLSAPLIIIIVCCVHISSVVPCSTHTGPQWCVTLMMPYRSSLLRWHHHHYHSISRPLIGRLVTIQPSHWLIVSCGVTDTERAARERHWRTSLLPHSLHTTELSSEQNVYSGNTRIGMTTLTYLAFHIDCSQENIEIKECGI